MASGFRNSAGVDFDSLFDPYQQGTKPANTGHRTSDGVDLANRYAPIAFGTKAPDVGFRLSSGADVSTLWAAKGTAKYTLPFDGATYTAGETVPAQSQGSASLALRLKIDGTYDIVRSTSHNGSSTLATGTWNTGGGAVSNYQVLATVTDTGGGTGPGTITNDAATWVSLSTQRNVSVALGPYGPSSGSHDAIDTVRVQIRRASDGVVLTDSTCTFNVSVDGSV
ncbi:hypothetical protein MBSD_n1556 [Mizugakiibacter sediminis]|uniref:Uncharacterized protein n=1 Tax=Mizugakiibacter sediminis TaxID=1475481 RepID=A0A0K8QPB7_9GAMM|nr:hypothetical protein [Mizugakiibacter sediminis]GAP66252.1 hypothetical protein MBSD_n1556 [Mizugakiibacter sediminis]